MLIEAQSVCVGGGKSKSWVSEKNCLNKVPLELCSEGQKESREKCVQAEITGGMVRDDEKGDKEESAHESFASQAKEYELYFGCFWGTTKRFLSRVLA